EQSGLGASSKGSRSPKVAPRRWTSALLFLIRLLGGIENLCDFRVEFTALLGTARKAAGEPGRIFEVVSGGHEVQLQPQPIAGFDPFPAGEFGPQLGRFPHAPGP